MSTWQHLRDLKLSQYRDAAGGWGKVSHRADAARLRTDREMTIPVRSTQKGETATRAAGELDRLSRNYQYIHSECGLIRTTLESLAADLEGPQRKLKQALEDAEALKFTVNGDGSVTYPPPVSKDGTLAPVPPGTHPPGKSSAEPLMPLAPGAGGGTARAGASVPCLPGDGEGGGNPNKAMAEDVAERIAGAVREASEIDARYASVLRKLKAPAGLDVTDDMLIDAAEDMRTVRKTVAGHLDERKIPRGKSPAENRKWWDSLTDEQRDEYATLFPATVGALDGLPSEVRDTSNRIVLAETRAQLTQEYERLGPEPPQYVQGGDTPAAVVNPAWQQWQRAGGARVRDMLKGMNDIQARLDASGVPGPNGKPGLPQAYLLSFDTKGLGHAVIANGNPDTADNTAVYVPGTGARLANAGGDIKRMTDTWQEAHAQAPDKTTSTITWIGYDAPQNILTDSPSPSYAHDSAPKLNTFLEGLQTARSGSHVCTSSSHTTVIAHSYGTTVVGAATKEHHIAAHDIVVAGSPGMLVGDASDLGVGSDHLWSEAARDDPVPYIGRQFLGGEKWGVQHYHGVPYNAGYITTIPSDEAFGGHRMDVDTSGHSGYWDEGSMSLKNQARVVVGQYDLVKEEK
ncbi:alpha/beta hydrolase [Streptomyces sp. NBC_00557]|uniref:alpha/beta hydrolase n=1 Tax=Streptomyces sp. NBC_00557 TaxID=2975776 RepID=UPI002E80DB89|nr:alpha/beta hydrolase [Streptomyces sp. NBC_00557]WUC35006.1 alpha/beta hydrolase family protein [Streptomyces sp. NBC_00557]